MKEPNELLMLVKCINDEYDIKAGEICWCVTEHNSFFNAVFYKVIENRREYFVNCGSKDVMLENYEIITEPIEIIFEEKQLLAYNTKKIRETKQLFPASLELFEQIKQGNILIKD